MPNVTQYLHMTSVMFDARWLINLPSNSKKKLIQWTALSLEFGWLSAGYPNLTNHTEQSEGNAHPNSFGFPNEFIKLTSSLKAKLSISVRHHKQMPFTSPKMHFRFFATSNHKILLFMVT